MRLGKSTILFPVLLFLKNNNSKCIRFLSVVIPARDEEGCIQSTVEHLHLELGIHKVPHEIIVVDDGSSDSTWSILVELAKKIPTLRPVQNRGPHGFGRAITKGLDSMSGDAVVIMMADESDDCRDVVRLMRDTTVFSVVDLLRAEVLLIIRH